MSIKISYDKVMAVILPLFAFTVAVSTGACSVLIVIGALIMLAQGIRERRWPDLDKRMVQVIAFFLGLQLVIATFSWNPAESFYEIRAMAYRFLPLFFPLLYLKSRRQLVVVVAAILLGILVDDAVALYQVTVLDAPRPKGLNNSWTFITDHLMMAMMVALLGMFKSYMPRWLRRLALLAFVISMVVLILSWTRGAWLAMGCAMLLFVWGCRRVRRTALALLMVGVLLFGAALAGSPGMRDRLCSIGNLQYNTNMERLLMWQSAAQIMEDYPLVGIGQRQFGLAYNTQYISPLARERAPEGHPEKGHGHPHSNVMQHAAEGGLVGLAAFFLLHGFFCWRLWQAYKREKGRMDLSYGLIGLLIFVSIQLEGLTDTTLNQAAIAREYWFLLGTMLAAGKFRENGQEGL